MADSSLEFKWLEAKCTGNDTVVFRLEDGAVVKIKVDIDRAGVAIDFKSPDGTPHYNVNASLKINIIPPGKTYTVPRSQLGPFPTQPSKKPPFVA